MFCKNCGKEINDNADFCIHCGVAAKVENAQRTTSPADAPSGGFAVLCFFFPIVGLILYLVWKDEFPLKAKSCGKGALISLIVGVAFFVLIYTILIIASISMAAAYQMPTSLLLL